MQLRPSLASVSELEPGNVYLRLGESSAAVVLPVHIDGNANRYVVSLDGDRPFRPVRVELAELLRIGGASIRVQDVLDLRASGSVRGVAAGALAIGLDGLFLALGGEAFNPGWLHLDSGKIVNYLPPCAICAKWDVHQSDHASDVGHVLATIDATL